MERVLENLRVLSELEESCKFGTMKGFCAGTPSVIQFTAMCQTSANHKSLLRGLHLLEMALILYSASGLQD